MRYKRITPKDLVVATHEKVNSDEGYCTVLNYIARLWALENKIESGELIDVTKPFIQVDNTCSGKTWYNICTPFISAVVHEQCASMEEAETKLKELKEKEND